MQDLTRKIMKWMETVNTAYTFALVVSGVVFFVVRQSHFAPWIGAAFVLCLAGWGGYLLNEYRVRRSVRYGFTLRDVTMTYEINGNNRYKLKYLTKIKAATSHLMMYPIAYQWTGNGGESIPKVMGAGQRLLAPVKGRVDKHYVAKVVPYIMKRTSTGAWHYWFIAFDPPVHQGDEVTLNYAQDFHDIKGEAEPYLYYFVPTSMKRLELNVKFPAHAKPQKVVSEYIKPSDPSRPYAKAGVEYNPDKLWATWVINNPKKGYCYRIHWQ
jgi:hypothetical protein